MKFRKPSPDKLMGHSEVMDFYDSLPDEFEILGPGEVAVKWPEGITKGRLNDLAKFFAREGRTIAAGELHALAAIAPERKKRRETRWVGWHDGEIVMRNYRFEDAIMVEIED